MTRRIIQFSTGNVGVHALRAIIERPDLELVGVHASGPDKIGRDAADLCGLGRPTGVMATDDVDALVALGADCVVYTSQAETRPHKALSQITRFLQAGTNVVGTSFVWLVAPDQADDWLRRPLADACAAGDTTLYINGVDPGFSGDTLVYTALSLATRATAITVQEICDYGSYPDAEFTGVSFGFGTTPDHTPILLSPGVLTSMWGVQVRSLAADLGVELDEVRERHEKWVTPEPIDCTMMRVEPGQVAADPVRGRGHPRRPGGDHHGARQPADGRRRTGLARSARRPTGRAPCRRGRQPRRRDQHAPGNGRGDRPQPGRRDRHRGTRRQRHRGGVPGAQRAAGRPRPATHRSPAGCAVVRP